MTGNRMNSLNILLFVTILYGSLETIFCVPDEKSFYDFSAKNIFNENISFDKYRHKVVLIVNVASQCGFTQSNYKQLNELYAKHSANGLEIIAFPCNQFGAQEPGDDTQILDFIRKTNVKFDVYSKVNVNGADAHPLFEWLKEKLPGVLNTSWIKWNFTKFLIDHNGRPVKRYSPTDEPNSIEPDILYLLDKASEKTKHNQEL